MPSLASLLVLAGGGFPAGTHVHSGGLEAAVASNAITDIPSLESFLYGRLADTGQSDAGIAAASAARRASWARLDAEAAARCPSPSLRNTSRLLGRGLLRAGCRVWPSSELEELAMLHCLGPMQPVAWGAVAMAANLGPVEAATGAAASSLNGPATAAVRLLGLDPFSVTALLARLAPLVDEIARSVTRLVIDGADLADLPAPGAPFPDLAAEDHAMWTSRLFAS